MKDNWKELYAKLQEIRNSGEDFPIELIIESMNIHSKDKWVKDLNKESSNTDIVHRAFYELIDQRLTKLEKTVADLVTISVKQNIEEFGETTFIKGTPIVGDDLSLEMKQKIEESVNNEEINGFEGENWNAHNNHLKDYDSEGVILNIPKRIGKDKIGERRVS